MWQFSGTARIEAPQLLGESCTYPGRANSIPELALQGGYQTLVGHSDNMY